MNSVVVEGKVCRKCGETKALSEFCGNKKSKDGFDYACKSCKSDNVRRWRSDPAVYLRQTIRKTVANASSRAVKRNQPFDVNFFTEAFVAQVFAVQDQMSCPLCLSKFEKRKEASLDGFLGVTSRSALSFDCVIPEVGYTRDNVMAICYQCNANKSNNRIDWFKRVVGAIESRMGLINMPRIDPPGCTP